jgi:hypothetical protein
MHARAASRRRARDLRDPARGTHEVARDLDERRLAGAVRSAAEELPVLDLEVDAPQRIRLAVPLLESADGEREVLVPRFASLALGRAFGAGSVGAHRNADTRRLVRGAAKPRRPPA